VNEPLFHTDFSTAPLDPRLEWFNPPGRWRLEKAPPRLVVEPDARTDFWQQTHYVMRADNGHLLALSVQGDFVLTTRVRLHPRHQYDQAGLMLRGDAETWIKASVEHEPDGLPQLGAVVTQDGYSDWSLQDFGPADIYFQLRILRRGADVLVEFAPPDGARWKLLRMTHWVWHDHLPIRAGIYTCCPKEAGLSAEFDFLNLARPTTPTSPNPPS
jgi:regulation of enolase protein 1 (concanavalin A-like superfamily)